MMTKRILVAYHSSEGQTETVAHRIADTLRAAGVDVDLADADSAPPPDGYNAVVAGDSIHAGRHSRALSTYLSHHAETLAALPVAIFQVSLTSATDDAEHTTEAHNLLRQLLDDTGLDPDIVGLFAGALRYTRYGWLKRHVMASIAKSEGADSDTSRDHEYTDWDAVDHFARDVAALTGEAAVNPPS